MRKRNNPSIVISSGDFHLVVDAGKTFRDCVLERFSKLGIRYVDTLLLTHGHMDAMNGMDDLREVQPGGTTLPVYMDAHCASTVIRAFHYMFPNQDEVGHPFLWTAHCKANIVVPFEEVRFPEQGLSFIPIPLYHGDSVAMGYLFRTSTTQFAYFSDFRCRSSAQCSDGTVPPVLDCDIHDLTFFIDPERSIALLKEMPIDGMMLDALTWIQKSYFSHSSIHETIRIVQRMDEMGIRPKQVRLTGMSCYVNEDETNAKLAEAFADSSIHVACGYDGYCLKME